MKYMGSKNRIAKYILPIILEDRKPRQWYIEPFVGGANMIDKVEGDRRIGFDADKAAIDGLLLIKNNPDKLPKNNTEMPEDLYQKIRADKNHLLHGYTAYQLSYAGKRWGGVL